jgi:hypothetical protein
VLAVCADKEVEGVGGAVGEGDVHCLVGLLETVDGGTKDVSGFVLGGFVEYPDEVATDHVAFSQCILATIVLEFALGA